MNKINLYYIKCRKAAINTSSIELTFCIDIINRLCSYCSDCGLEKITAIDREELNHYWKNLASKKNYVIIHLKTLMQN